MDNRIQFAELPRNRSTITSRPRRSDVIGQAQGIEHRLSSINHRWSCDDQNLDLRRSQKSCFLERRSGGSNDLHQG